MSTSFLHLLFFTLLILGAITSISSTSWFMVWIGLELNLMTFIPLITSKFNQFPSEAALKYFLIQALGSSLIILASPLILNSEIFMLSMLMALLLKLGAAPFHFWVPSIMEGLNWNQCVILMTIQKAAPLSLITHLTHQTKVYYIIIFSAILSSIFGSLGGLNQTSLRKILAFSSINHLSWMLIAITLSDYSWIMYFTFYSLISSSVIFWFNTQQFFYFSQLFSKPSTSAYLHMSSALTLLSLGGLPPFSGFIPKLIIIEIMTSKNMFFPLFFLILSTLITLYYYLRMSIIFFMMTTTKTKSLHTFMTHFKSNMSPIMTSMNFFFLLTPSLFMLF
uniref:NADH-ubiquinone oxidoreductase chain 2 n=1 Tax=Ibacus alticrenatus TaxID=762106 RepID=A0A411ATP4_9EUCA|nr:NADH dehydrogenase subunit 2 [Ibacus alticrenatus]QAX91373.1 NADH dehydrogenase subunit 2 [Ibacus alticrenatus]